MVKNSFYEYVYLVYGLIVQSEIPLPELVVYDIVDGRTPDVTISFGELPKNIINELKKGKDHCFEKEEIWFSIKDTATYYIKNTNCIQVEIFPKANLQNVKTFLLGSAFGMLLIKRNNIAIHGGAVVINEKGIIVTGDSGAGKSTLTAALREKGYNFLADDVSVIGEDEKNNLMVMPGYPQQKLCGDAIDKFKYRDIMGIKKIEDNRDKYSIKIEEKFRRYPSTLNAIYELSIADVKTVEVIKVIGREKLDIIFNNIFRFGLIKYIGIDPVYFNKCLKLANNIEIYKIKRPRVGDTTDQQIKLIEENLNPITL